MVNMFFSTRTRKASMFICPQRLALVVVLFSGVVPRLNGGPEFKEQLKTAARSLDRAAVVEVCSRQLKASPTDVTAQAILNLEKEHRRGLSSPELATYALALVGDFEAALEALPGMLKYEDDLTALKIEILERIADAAVRHDKTRQVIHLCEEWASRAPETDVPFLLSARCYLRNENLQAAELQLRVAKLITPENPDAETLLGRLSLLRGEVDESERHLRKAMVDGSLSYALAGLVEVASRRRDSQACSKLAGAAIQEAPKMNHARLAMAKAFSQSGDKSAGREACLLAAQHDPLDAQARYTLSVMTELAGMDASNSWQQFLKLESNTPRATRVKEGFVMINKRTLPSGTRHPAFSPDGRCLAFVRPGQSSDKLMIRDTAFHSPPREIRIGRQARLSHLSWAPDGKRIAFHLEPISIGSFRRGVFVKDLDSDKAAWILLQDVTRPRFSPDGWQVLTTSLTEPRQVRSVDLTGHVILESLPLTWSDWSQKGSFIVGSQRYSMERGDIWMYRSRHEKGGRRLTSDAQNSSPRFRPGGRCVTFLRKSSLCRAALYAVSASGKGVPFLVYQPEKDMPFFLHDWAPDGRSVIVDSGDSQEILQFGGLNRKLVDIEFIVNERRLVITAVNLTRQIQSCVLSYRVFDNDSVQLQSGRLTRTPLILNAGEVHFTIIELTQNARWKGATIKFVTTVSSELADVTVTDFPGNSELAGE
jgi:tetratricopeptide (TPR) repeat protein